MIGTVAGDDTVLVVAAEDAGGALIAARLAELAGTNGSAANDSTNDGTDDDDVMRMAQDLNGAQ